MSLTPNHGSLRIQKNTRGQVAVRLLGAVHHHATMFLPVVCRGNGAEDLSFILGYQKASLRFAAQSCEFAS